MVVCVVLPCEDVEMRKALAHEHLEAAGGITESRKCRVRARRIHHAGSLSVTFPGFARSDALGERGIPCVEMAVAYLREERSEMVHAFLGVLREVIPPSHGRASGSLSRAAWHGRQSESQRRARS